MTHFPPFMYKHKSIFSFLGCTVGACMKLMPSLTITNQFCSESSHNVDLLSGEQFNYASGSLLTADKGFIH